MRACREGVALPDLPGGDLRFQWLPARNLPGATRVPPAGASRSSRTGNQLNLLQRATRVALEPAVDAENAFNMLHPDFEKCLLFF